jgi:hypothetical protein
MFSALMVSASILFFAGCGSDNDGKNGGGDDKGDVSEKLVCNENEAWVYDMWAYGTNSDGKVIDSILVEEGFVFYSEYFGYKNVVFGVEIEGNNAYIDDWFHCTLNGERDGTEACRALDVYSNMWSISGNTLSFYDKDGNIVMQSEITTISKNTIRVEMFEETLTMTKKSINNIFGYGDYVLD